MAIPPFGRPLLGGDQAMTLWRQGRAAWNAWVKDNPEADIDFSGQVFSATANKDGEHIIDFAGFTFPAGLVSFTKATFGAGDVSFAKATFGEGEVSFWDANFGAGDVRFDNATFGAGSVNFWDAAFGAGEVSFANATFDEGEVSFVNATFGAGEVSFDNAAFDEGEVIFDYAAFGTGRLNFDAATFAAGTLRFRFATFAGPAYFTDLRGVGGLTICSFEGASFEKNFIFSHQQTIGCPLDLRRTKMSHHMVVNDIRCDYAMRPVPRWASRASQLWSGYTEHTAPVWRWTTQAENREDSQRFRRLKELALANRNHGKALEFHMQEIQSKRGHETRCLQNFAQCLFWMLSDYGRSVLRPFLWIIVTIPGFALLFWRWRAPLARTGVGDRGFMAAIHYSASNMLPFIPISRTAREQGEAVLFGAANTAANTVTVPDPVLVLSAVQSLIAVLLLFLLSLGLRNLFRM